MQIVVQTSLVKRKVILSSVKRKPAAIRAISRDQNRTAPQKRIHCKNRFILKGTKNRLPPEGKPYGIGTRFRKNIRVTTFLSMIRSPFQAAVSQTPLIFC